MITQSSIEKLEAMVSLRPKRSSPQAITSAGGAPRKRAAAASISAIVCAVMRAGSIAETRVPRIDY